MPLALVALAFLAPPTPFPAATHGAGSLRYEQGVAVLRLRGTPQEIGEQWGVLAVKNAPDVDGLRRRFLDAAGLGPGEFALMLMAARLEKGTPADHLAEMRAASWASGRPIAQAHFANGLYDLSGAFGCATIAVSPGRSSTGGTLLGRNFDWDPIAGTRDHTLLAIVSPTGKHSFASVTISPIGGVFSGMNDAGLVCTLNQVTPGRSGEKVAFDWNGTPTMLLARRVLEECATLDESEKLVRSAPRTTSAAFTLADSTGGRVLEFTPKTVAARAPQGGVVCCTNHFEAAGLRPASVACARLPQLQELRAGPVKLGPAELFARLHRVNQGELTLQTMVFDGQARTLRLKLADAEGPASGRVEELVFELGKMWGNEKTHP